ncbi:hypothetical protein JG688_00008518 [Phytophthora aleatoria]|uniref:Uncharacterized protein n=1 Tax=Phytophthora aleatoria TaxID=2496075 RepID=A0A8J5M7C2_9STRA|nr:hypothetical protein JG688_00008518 [Phytophthora aleatoria]
MCSWYQPLPLKARVAKVQTAQGVRKGLMGPVNSGRVQRNEVHQKHRNKVLRQVLGRHYLYLRDGSFQGAIPLCVASKLIEYWPDERSKVGIMYYYAYASGSLILSIGVIVLLLRLGVKATGWSVDARQTPSSEARN